MAACRSCGRSWGTRPSVPRVSFRRRPWSIPYLAPSAPGNRPNISSKLRFSLTMNTTCLIGHRVWKRDASPWNFREESELEPVQPDAMVTRAAANATIARTRPVRQADLDVVVKLISALEGAGALIISAGARFAGEHPRSRLRRAGRPRPDAPGAREPRRPRPLPRD